MMGVGGFSFLSILVLLYIYISEHTGSFLFSSVAWLLFIYLCIGCNNKLPMSLETYYRTFETLETYT